VTALALLWLALVLGAAALWRDRTFTCGVNVSRMVAVCLAGLAACLGLFILTRVAP
jgi:hypothetical protein